ncbi:hypothetical protein [Escherichia coli]
MLSIYIIYNLIVLNNT